MELSNVIIKTYNTLLIGIICFIGSPLRANEKGLPSVKREADTVIAEMNFGMRARTVPKNYNKIHAPIVIRKAPTNEATLIRLNSGLIKIFYINRPGKADKMMSMSSNNNGLTWSDPLSEFDLPGEAYYANQVMQDRNGKIHCIFHIFRPGKMGYRGRHLDLWYTSMEPGSEWSTPRMIWEGYVGSIRGFIQLKNGNLIIPMSESDTARAIKPKAGQQDYGLFQVISLNSSDHGKTWTKSENNVKIQVDPDQVTRYGGVEPVAIELKNERIWMLIRTNKGFLYESFSHDNGKNWEDAKQTSFISSDSPASLLRLSKGEIILFLNSDQRYDDKRSYANGGREALQAAISKDDGISWMGFREVLTSPAKKPIPKGDRGTAYPSAIETKDGNIVFVSGQGEEAVIVMFNKKWLEEKKQKDEKKEGPVYWTLHGTSGESGVWNFPMSEKGRLTIKINSKLYSGPFEFALTNHFSVAHDSLASKMSSFRIYFQENDFTYKSNTVTFQWDLTTNKGVVYLNNKKISNTKLWFRPTGKGYNYLRATSGPHAGNIYEICNVAMTSK